MVVGPHPVHGHMAHPELDRERTGRPEGFPAGLGVQRPIDDAPHDLGGEFGPSTRSVKTTVFPNPTFSSASYFASTQPVTVNFGRSESRVAPTR